VGKTLTVIVRENVCNKAKKT